VTTEFSGPEFVKIVLRNFYSQFGTKFANLQ